MQAQMHLVPCYLCHCPSGTIHMVPLGGDGWRPCWLGADSSPHPPQGSKALAVLTELNRQVQGVGAEVAEAKP